MEQFYCNRKFNYIFLRSLWGTDIAPAATPPSRPSVIMAMCPRSGASEVAEAVARCPFLHAVNNFQGEECAARLAVNPFTNVQLSHSLPVLPEDPAGSVAAVFKLFHGKGGPIPLKDAATTDPPRQGRCPMHNHSGSTTPNSTAPQTPEPELYAAPALPMMASISLSGFRFLVSPLFISRQKAITSYHPQLLLCFLLSNL